MEDDQGSRIVWQEPVEEGAGTREGGPQGSRRGARIRPPVYYTRYCELCAERGECAMCMGEISAEAEQYSDGDAFCYRCRCSGHHGMHCPGAGESATRTSRKGSQKKLAVARGRRGGKQVVDPTSHDVPDVVVSPECRLVPHAVPASHSCSWSMPFRAGRGFRTGWTLDRRVPCDAHWAGLGWANDPCGGTAGLVVFLLLVMSFGGSGGGIGGGSGSRGPVDPW